MSSGVCLTYSCANQDIFFNSVRFPYFFNTLFLFPSMYLTESVSVFLQMNEIEYRKRPSQNG